ncbi:MAG: hypothetical protein V2I35_02610, partial [Desulfocapsaceae bacterium]|nr:hypothetical protein [Desulfocapsaceae bacterium]
KQCSRAITMVREHTIILCWLVFVGLLNTLTTLIADTPFSRTLSALSFILSICSTPVIYGIYYELIEDIYSSLAHIIRSYTLPYLWLLVRMYLPVIMIAWLPMIITPDSASGGHFHVILVSFSLIYLYVLPFFYFTGKQQGSILMGITFLFRNISASTPLILVVLLLETLLLLVHYNKEALLARSTYLFAVLDFSSYIVASIIDFILFIVLILILKDEFGKDFTPLSK